MRPPRCGAKRYQPIDIEGRNTRCIRGYGNAVQAVVRGQRGSECEADGIAMSVLTIPATANLVDHGVSERCGQAEGQLLGVDAVLSGEDYRCRHRVRSPGRILAAHVVVAVTAEHCVLAVNRIVYPAVQRPGVIGDRGLEDVVGHTERKFPGQTLKRHLGRNVGTGEKSLPGCGRPGRCSWG